MSREARLSAGEPCKAPGADALGRAGAPLLLGVAGVAVQGISGLLAGENVCPQLLPPGIGITGQDQRSGPSSLASCSNKARAAASESSAGTCSRQ